MDTSGAGDKKAVSQVVAELNNSGMAVERLSKVIGTLEDSLHAVIKEKVAPPESTDKKAEPLVPLAENVRSLNESIRQQASRLEDFINRLEL